MSHQSFAPLQPGFVAFHSNRSEDLAQVMVSWIQRHPLGPLEEDIILVQSNGMAEWVKMELARMGGVCAATRVELPSRFLWRTYRQVLGRQAVPADSPLDKIPMIWRLMQLLPTLLAEPDFAPVAGFLRADEPDRLLQLATQLADLFDQYQNYRADWLDAWAQGHDHLIRANSTVMALPPEQRWQPQLWRAVLDTLNAQQQANIRPQLHQRVLARLGSGEPLASAVARRVIVFGMSQIPWTTLQALAALASHSQVMLAIPNPCRYYWGDIMDGRELLNAQRKRQPMRGGRDLSVLPLDEMHAHAHPLLASWGRQGRDFIRQLDVFDDAEQSKRQFDLARIDLFDETEESEQTTWLCQVQNRIRDLTPLHEHPTTQLAPTDDSIVFHSAHSMVRELEILHDQLLHLLAQPEQGKALNPRDVIVMVPDIEPMAPAIRAVFGQYKRQDQRFIPFDIADMSAKASSPVIGAVQWLLNLPHQRCRMSELVDLMEVTAVATRFGIEAESLPKLTQWMTGAGIRWGLNEDHRSQLGLAACGEQNSAWFGLRRMLLGYASGAVPAETPWVGLRTLEPYAEVGGLEAALAGSLAHLLQALIDWWSLANMPATPATWAARGRNLLSAVLKANSETDKQALQALEDGLVAWQMACEQANFEDEVPLTVARAAWLEAMQVPTLNQRFRAGGVTFCTLMPMRAIPFEVVCLLGMNDGDYPRRGMRSDFDLMGLTGTSRPGDRSRREDDRQLMLEALLSARRQLYVSWCGRSVRDNSEQPPSVLVSQLRDYLEAGWGADAVAVRTTQHPLQPFSRRYFELGSPLLTHALEWRQAHEAQGTATMAPLSAFTPTPGVPLTLNQLTQFLRKPVQAFFRHRLLVNFTQDQDDNADLECFQVEGLDEYKLVQGLLAKATAEIGGAQQQRQLSRALQQLQAAGDLPMRGFGEIKHDALQTVVGTMLEAWHEAQARFPRPAERHSMRLQEGDVVLEDWIDNLQLGEPLADPQAGAPPGQALAWLQLEPGKLLSQGSKPTARRDKLLGPWVRSLAVAASGVQATGILIGRDAVVEISPLSQPQAIETLRRLLKLWLQGMQAPLPLPPQTALAWLAGKGGAQAAYEGGHTTAGEVTEPCMARMFPDFESLSADGSFEALTQQVYAPLQDWANTHISTRAHTAA
jgi:exodeoxyribonuclease V gamma subunit